MTDDNFAGGQRRKQLTFRYFYRFQDGTVKSFDIVLDYGNLELVLDGEASGEHWTALEFHQCPPCPLDPEERAHCPAAVSLQKVIEFFKHFQSYARVEVRVETDRRTFTKEVSLQEAVSSHIGLLMAASGCPVLELFRPMVDTHLPFMNAEETTYRMTSMYLLGQFFRHKKGQAADWNMERLAALLEDVTSVNIHFCRRLHDVLEIDGDVSTNAISLLNTLGQLAGFSLDLDLMDRLGKIFRSYHILNDS